MANRDYLTGNLPSKLLHCMGKRPLPRRRFSRPTGRQNRQLSSTILRYFRFSNIVSALQKLLIHRLVSARTVRSVLTRESMLVNWSPGNPIMYAPFLGIGCPPPVSDNSGMEMCMGSSALFWAEYRTQGNSEVGNTT